MIVKDPCIFCDEWTTKFASRGYEKSVRRVIMESAGQGACVDAYRVGKWLDSYARISRSTFNPLFERICYSQALLCD